MPSLTIFGRRWLSGSDDFFITGMFFGVWNFICTMLLWLPYFPGNCPQPLALPLGAICVGGSALFFFLTFFTCRGRILEPSARSMVSPILYLCVAQNIALVIVGIYSVVEFFKEHFPSSCTHREQISLKVAGIKTLILPVLFFGISYVLRWDAYGAVPESELRQNIDLYHETWVKKLKKAFCCFSFDDNSEYFDHVAGILAFLFQGHDIVPTDILAGLALLGSHQRRVMLERSQQQASYYNMKKCAKTFKVSHQAMMLPHLTEQDRKVVDEISHYSRYFMAAYGWALFLYKDLKCGMCKLCGAGCCCGCCHTRPGKHIGDNCCYCNNIALAQTARIDEDDILMTSFYNDIMRPAFYVALDRATNTIVIVIRGTMSLEDTLVDLVATPARIAVSDLLEPVGVGVVGTSAENNIVGENNSASASAASESNNNDNDNEHLLGNSASSNSPSGSYRSGSMISECVVHGGILKSSMNVLETLKSNNIIKTLLEGGAHQDKHIKIIGHSLGAGCAAILSLLLRERHPELKSRLTCMAVSPPGGLMSRDLSEYMQSFCVSPFVGMDLIPRLGLHIVETARDAIFECLTAAEHNKNLVLLHSVCPFPCCGGSLLPEPETVPELPNEVSQRINLLLQGNNVHRAEKVAHARDAKIEKRSVARQEKQQKKKSGTSSSPSSSPAKKPSSPVTNDNNLAVPFNSTEEKSSPSKNTTTEESSSNAVATSSSISIPQIQSNSNNLQNNSASSSSGFFPSPSNDHDPLHKDYSQHLQIKLYPPGKMLMYANIGSTSEGCCNYMCGQSGIDSFCSSRIHLPTWVSVDELQEIISCPSMALDHFPDRCQNIFEFSAQRVRSGEFDGCFVSSSENEEERTMTTEQVIEKRLSFKSTCFSSPHLKSTSVSFEGKNAASSGSNSTSGRGNVEYGTNSTSSSDKREDLSQA